MGEYISALLGNWVALMSGIVGLLIALGLRVGRHLSDAVRRWPDIQDLVFICIGIGCLFWAGYSTWKDEQAKVTALTIELEKQKSPKLDAEFDVFSVAPAGEKNESSVVFTTATITNTGAPSIVDRIVISIKIGAEEIKGQSFFLPEGPINLEGGGMKLMFKSEDYLPRKCMLQPIATGGAMGGGLPLFFSGVESEKVLQSGTVIILSFQDVSHRFYRFEKTMTGEITPPLNLETLQKLGH